jgi:eukaryotic-like serine/threonine-protein kinase
VGLLASIKKLFASNPHSKIKRVDLDKRFEMLGKSGQGSMSKVFRVRDRSLGREFYLKVLDKEKTAKFEARFAGLNRPNEGEIAVSLRHQNVVKTFETGLSTLGEWFLVMEPIEGQGLNFHIENRTAMIKGNRINLLRQMADGLEYIHKAGYIHRDICPRNFMITDADKVLKYIDFGLTIPRKAEFFRPGNRTGTADYLAPEVIKRMTTDHRVDLFALGVTAYELFTAALPWPRARSQQTLLEHINNPGVTPREHVADLDERVVKFLMKAVERDPRERYQTAEEFRDAVVRLPKGL